MGFIEGFWGYFESKLVFEVSFCGFDVDIAYYCHLMNVT